MVQAFSILSFSLRLHGGWYTKELRLDLQRRRYWLG